MRAHQATALTTLGMCFVMLAACGGGGGGHSSTTSTTTTTTTTTNPTGAPVVPRNDGVSLGLDATELSFAAANASAATPPTQQVLAYFDDYKGKLQGDLYLQLTLSGAAVGNSSTMVGRISIDANGNLMSSDGITIIDGSSSDLVNVGRQETINTGRGKTITITVPRFVRRGTSGTTTTGTSSIGMAVQIPAVAPATLGAGKFTGTATIRACLGDSTCASGEIPGSPRTINIAYVVDPVASGTLDNPVDAVMPRIQVANTAGSFVIRGQGLSGVTSVRFGSTAATTVMAVSNTEVRAQVPAMPAGTYAVTLNGGAVAFNGSVQVLPSATAGAQVLTYPGVTPDRATAAVYDDARQALLVVLAASNPADNKVVRYVRTTTGEWTGTAISVPNLNDLVLANDGSRFLGVTDDTVVELSLDTLTVQRTVTAPASLGSARLQRLALGNDGRAVITTINGRFLSPAFLYSTLNGSFSPLNNAGQLQAADEAAGLVATDDGARIFVTQSVTGAAVLDYASSNDVVSARPVSLFHVDDQPLAVDQNASRVIPYDGLPDTAKVLDGNFMALSTLKTDEPGVFNADAVVVNRAGTRAVALRDDGNFYFFDLMAAPAANGNALQTDAPLALNFNGGGAIQTAITADGQVAFFAGKSGVAVVPITK